MTILFNSAQIAHHASFGAGLEDVPPPAIAAKAPRHPSTADQLYWQAYQLGLDGEDPATPTGLSTAERAAWVAGLAAGSESRWEEFGRDMDRLEALEAAYLDGCGHDDGPRGAWGGHPAYEC